MSPALALIVIYLVITAVLQFAGFIVSWFIDKFDPTIGLLTFVILFISMFWLAWPIAVRISGAWFPDTKPGAPA